MTSQSGDEHRGLRGAIDKAEDALAGAVGMSSASTTGSKSAKMFVMNAVISNRYEIEAARKALATSANPEVKSFAERMIQDHTEVGRRMEETVASVGLESQMPDHLDKRHEGMLDNLATAPAEAFDRRYIEQQLAAHREAVALFEGFAEHGDNPELKRLAAETAPKLRQHLQLVEGMRGH